MVSYHHTKQRKLEPTLQALPLKSRFAILLTMMCVMMLVVGGVGLYAAYLAEQAYDAEESMMNGSSEAVDTARNAQLSFKTQVQEWKNILLRGQDEAAYNKHLQAFEGEVQHTRLNLQAFKQQLTALQQPSTSVDVAMSQLDGINEKYHAALQHYDRRSVNPGLEVDKLVKGLDRELVASIDKGVEQIQKYSKQQQVLFDKTGHERASFYRTLMLACMALALLIGGLSFVIIMRTVNGINGALAAFRSIAQGKLDNDVPINGMDEVGLMLGGLASMQVQTRVMLDEIRHAVLSLTERMGEMDAAATHAARQSEQQHDGVMRVSAAMEQVSVSVSEVANNADNVVGAAEKSLDVVVSGGKQMDKSIGITRNVVDSMQSSAATIAALSSAVDRIGGMTQVIREIADQTNLLALNAAIEAARAGEQGRGFAVVADEVRKLAERTGKSTADIAAMLTEVSGSTQQVVDSMKKSEVEVGEARACLELAVNSFGDIRKGSNNVAEMASSIAHATREQANANQDVSLNMEQMSQQIEQTMRVIEGVRQSAQEMTASTDELRGILRQYNLNI